MKKETKPKIVRKTSLYSNPVQTYEQGNSQIANPTNPRFRAPVALIERNKLKGIQ